MFATRLKVEKIVANSLLSAMVATAVIFASIASQ
jgi:hypothetical protein